MTILQGKIRTFGLSAVMVALGLVAAFFALTTLAEQILARERRIGNVVLRVHRPDVSARLAVRADSLELSSPDFRLAIVHPSGRLADWAGLRPSAALVLHADSMDLSLHPQSAGDAAPPVFPAALRFPVDVSLEWRVLTVRVGGAPDLHIGPARWNNRGTQALHGAFAVRVLEAPPLQAVLDARWRGPALRYRLEASHPGEASLLVSGIREKRDLAAGHDSLAVFLAQPRAWFPPEATAGFPAFSRLDLAGKMDWRKDSLRFTGRFATPGKPPFDSANWNVAVRLGPGGGRFQAEAAGGTQSLSARGNWRHPGASLSFSEWSRWQGELSGEFKGGDWKLRRWSLPLDVRIPSARLDTGLSVTAQVVTRDASRIEARWSGRRPGRLEMTADVSPTEAWATVWTDTNVSFRAARVKAAWDSAGLHATVRAFGPRAYGAAADSLEAVNEVTSSGYFLRRGRVYRDGETFTGSGKVVWRTPTGRRGVSLDFVAEHPEHGRAMVAMDGKEFALSADSLRPARFPYEPARRFAAFDPFLHGRVAWNAVAGTGNVAVDGWFAGNGGAFDTRVDAVWNGDSLRVKRIRIAAGASQLEGSAALPFDGRSWTRLWDAQRLMRGAWKLRAEHLNPAEVLALAGRSGRDYRGLIHGELQYSPRWGMRGELRLDSARLSFAGGALTLGEGHITGLGDTVRIAAVLGSRARGLRHDTVRALLMDLQARAPVFRLETGDTAGLSVRVQGALPEWKEARGKARVAGWISLPGAYGTLEEIDLQGDFTAPLSASFARRLEFVGGESGFRHASANDTLRVFGTPSFGDGILGVRDLRIRNVAGEELAGRFEADHTRRSVRADLEGARMGLILPGGEHFRVQDLAAAFAWDGTEGVVASASASSGFVTLPTSPHRIETGFDDLRVQVAIPPASEPDASPRLTARGRIQDFLFQRKLGWRDVTGFFTGLGRSGRSPAPVAKRSRPWELDVELEASGARNRVDTDVLRANFTGDARISGVYPYMLVRGKLTGLQGEVGQPRQAYALRDLEVKWDNSTLEDGTLHVEGEKKLLADCRADTRQTCQIYIHLDGRLEDVEFTYDTDCGENVGEAVPPSVLINSMTQGCYVSETPGGNGNYGTAAVAMLDPIVNNFLSNRFSQGSGGFIKSTQVSGLSALMGDSTGLEAVSLEVESREVYRVGFKGKVGYHPETKLANPMEYRLAAEYRPPLERLASDSTWKARLKDRFLVEAAAETRPEVRDIEEERRVRQRAGLRYRHRFWNLW